MLLNLLLNTLKLPKLFEDSFYVDDCFTGANSIQEAKELQSQLQDLFTGGFLLRKWNSSEQSLLQDIPSDLKHAHPTPPMPDGHQYTKTLGIEWNVSQDHFRLTVADQPPMDNLTKHALVSDIAKTLDALGWFSSTISRCFYSNCGSRTLTGTSVFHHPFMMLGYNGNPNSLFSPPSTFPDAISIRAPTSPPQKFMDSVTPLKGPMQQWSISG